MNYPPPALPPREFCSTQTERRSQELPEVRPCRVCPPSAKISWQSCQEPFDLRVSDLYVRPQTHCCRPEEPLLKREAPGRWANPTGANRNARLLRASV